MPGNTATRVGNDTLAMRVGVRCSPSWERQGRLKFIRTTADVAVGLASVYDKPTTEEGIEASVAPYTGAAKVTRCKAAYLRSAFSATSMHPAPIITPLVPAAIVSIRLTPDEERAVGIHRDCLHKLRRFLHRGRACACLTSDQAEIHIPISWDALKQGIAGTIRVSQERATEATGTTPVITRILESEWSDRALGFKYPSQGARAAHICLQLFAVACWPEGRVRVIEEFSPLPVSPTSAEAPGGAVATPVATPEVKPPTSAPAATPVVAASPVSPGDGGHFGASPGQTRGSGCCGRDTAEEVLAVTVDAEEVGVDGFLPDRDSTAKERPLRSGIAVEFKDDDMKQYEVEKGLRDPCPVEGDRAYSTAFMAPRIKTVTSGLGATLHNERLGVSRHFAKETLLPLPSGKIRNTETLVMLAFMDELNAAFKKHLADPTTEYPVVTFPKKWGEVTVQCAEEGANFSRKFKMAGFVKTRELGLAPEKRPRLVATAGTGECGAHVPTVGAVEQLFKAVFGRWGFKGLDNKARDKKIENVARRAYHDRIVSADFSAMDSSWTFHEKFLMENLLRQAILAVLDAMPVSHFMVDPATTLIEAEQIRIDLKELVLTLEWDGLILFSGERGTSLFNRLLVLIIYACELIFAACPDPLIPNGCPEDLVARFDLEHTETKGGLMLQEWLREASKLRLTERANDILHSFIEAGMTRTTDEVALKLPVNVGDGDDAAMTSVWNTRANCIDRWALYSKNIVPKIARGTVEVLSRMVRIARKGERVYALSKAGRNLERTIATCVPAFTLREGESGPVLPIRAHAEYATMTLRRAAETSQMPFVRWFIFHAGVAHAEKAIRGGFTAQVYDQDFLRQCPEANDNPGTLRELIDEVRGELDSAHISGNVMHEWLLFENGENWVDVDDQGRPKWPQYGADYEVEAERRGNLWRALDDAAKEREFDPDHPLDNAEQYLRDIRMPAELARKGMLDLLQGELGANLQAPSGSGLPTTPELKCYVSPTPQSVPRSSGGTTPTVPAGLPAADQRLVACKDLAMDMLEHEWMSTPMVNGELPSPWKGEDKWWRHGHVCGFTLIHEGEGPDPMIPCGQKYTHIHRGGHRPHKQHRGSCPNPKCKANWIYCTHEDGTRVLGGHWCSESELWVAPGPNARSRPTRGSSGSRDSEAQEERATTHPVAGVGKTVGEAAVPHAGRGGKGKGRGRGRGPKN